jgi:hypothetical protein
LQRRFAGQTKGPAKWLLSPGKVIDKHQYSGKSFRQERLNSFPLAASQSASDARHVDGGVEWKGAKAQLLQALPEGVIADGRDAVASAKVALGDHVGNPDCLFHLNQVYGAELERLRRLVLEVLRPGLGPASGEGENESGAPSANVVADVGDDSVSRTDGGGGIARQVMNLGIYEDTL